jgi:hypothetical protein
MTQSSLSSPAPSGLPDVQRLPGILARYRDPNPAWSLAEIAMTVAPLVGLWAAMWGLLHVSYWLCLALALPAAGFLVRVFMIQHDCGHGAFFRLTITGSGCTPAIMPPRAISTIAASATSTP